MSISYYLGYIDDTQDPLLPPGRVRLVEDLLTRLTHIDQAIQEAVGDSMAVKLGETTVDYAQHLDILRDEGSRLVHQLARASGLALVYDIYHKREVNPGLDNSYNFVSYW